MITYIKINGFKSFHNFEMEFTPLTVIAGTNAAGKSNLFDALKLLSALADSDKIQRAFREQRGELLELFTQYDDHTWAEEMTFVVEMLVNSKVKDAWGGEVPLKYTRLRYELSIRRFENNIGLQDVEVIHEYLGTVKYAQDKWIKILPTDTADFWRPKVVSGKRQTPYLDTVIHNGVSTIEVPQDGSQGKKRYYPLKNASKTVLSSFDSVDFRHILAAKEEMKSWRFLQLNPDELRLPTSKMSGEDIISVSGQNLAAALFRIKQEDKYKMKEISRKLNLFLPNFVSVDVKDDVENKQYIIVLYDADKKEYTSRVLSEGTLRILTLCILWQDNNHTGLLCFEEPENGVHPFRIKTMALLLRDLSSDFTDKSMPLRQIIINTHSPVFVSEIHKWISDRNVTICFAEMVSRIVLIHDKKYKLCISKINPLDKERNAQTTILFSEQDRKLTLQMIKEYLQVMDCERP